MPLPLVLLAAGTAMQVIGQYGANMAQADAERKNAEFYRAQSDFAREAKMRELEITNRSYTSRIGMQYSAAAKGGADVGAGSIVNILADSAAAKIEELIAVKNKGNLDIALASMRGQNSEQISKTLSSTGYNAAQAGSTVLQSTAMYNNNRAG